VVEVQMVNRMMKRGVLLAPFVVALLWLVQGPRWGLSAAIGIAMALGNLLLAGRIIGGVAQNNPQLLFPAGMVAFALGLAVLTGIAFALKAADVVFFPVTGLTLIGAHLVLVLWEAAGAYARIEPTDQALNGRAANLRS
jgi:hypothetical protein